MSSAMFAVTDPGAGRQRRDRDHVHSGRADAQLGPETRDDIGVREVAVQQHLDQGTDRYPGEAIHP
ncbi:hypothetical protein [Virgisporangium aliadipatigenens]|uniref:hypothetical protein n=1 Tax=Virgisporangium aliadipatigenens TaxID=741659 RepID=UPI00194574B1|nr:hypothetical protein [Virgisporangium aliadipatigenens]